MPCIPVYMYVDDNLSWKLFLPLGGGYPPQTSAPGGCPPGVDPTVYAWFVAVDADKSGQITATELQQALTNGNWSHFNPEACRLMIGIYNMRMCLHSLVGQPFSSPSD